MGIDVTRNHRQEVVRLNLSDQKTVTGNFDGYIVD